MTDIKIYEKDILRFRAIFLICAFLAITTGLYFGFELNTLESCIIIPRSPFEDGFLDGAVKLCLFDIIAFWILTVPVSRVMTVIIASCLLIFRGMVIGNGCRVFFANSVSALCTFFLLSYIAVTIFLVIYDGYINTNGEKSASTRILSCFIATGACALIRILPMLLIK